MYETRRNRCACGENGSRIRRPGSTVSRLGSSGNLEKSFLSTDSVSERILGAGARLSGGVSEMHESRRKRGASGGEWPQNQTARIDGQSVRIFRGSREIPAIAGFGVRKNSRRKGEIKRGRVSNVRKSAKTRRDRGESPRIRRPGSTANRLGSSGNLEQSQRSQVSVSERILGGRERD